MLRRGRYIRYERPPVPRETSKEKPGLNGHVFLCAKCRVGFNARGWSRHVRECLGIKRCPGCALPFPCKRAACDIGVMTMETRVLIPPEFVPYFRCESTRWRRVVTPEVVALEPAALAWLESLNLPPRSE